MKLGDIDLDGFSDAQKNELRIEAIRQNSNASKFIK